ncbi:hypothetical protein [Sporosarcina aquimarina]|uniref:YesK-like protein n=1 Tax=Sporosarcina aquimarina TaxID=114975 RepID=A0ABU4FXR3_9BACL|nr:hypothetical protein [Sporosarcina aquimarina]MDW0109436.1 hypothetical protein [Sporosarcina aquimarina]
MASEGLKGIVFLGVIVLFVLLFIFKNAAHRFKVTFSSFLIALLSFAIVYLPGIGYILFLFWALGFLFSGLGIIALLVETILFVKRKKKQDETSGSNR